MCSSFLSCVSRLIALPRSIFSCGLGLRFFWSAVSMTHRPHLSQIHGGIGGANQPRAQRIHGGTGGADQPRVRKSRGGAGGIEQHHARTVTLLRCLLVLQSLFETFKRPSSLASSVVRVVSSQQSLTFHLTFQNPASLCFWDRMGVSRTPRRYDASIADLPLV